MRRVLPRPLFPAACAVVLLGALTGCQKAPLQPSFDAREQALVVRQSGPRGLVQVVRITPAEPAPGDTLHLESVLTNEGITPVHVQSRICGFDIETELHLTGSSIRCAGYSMTGPLARGDTLRESEGGVLASGPGVYSVRLRHLLNPEHWITFQVTVRSR